MLFDVNEVAVDQQVWLYPHTRTASANVHRMLAVKVMKDPKAHWPMVLVCWKEGNQDKWELVHKDDIRKRNPTASTKAEHKQGDTIGDGPTSSKLGTSRRLVMPGAKKYQPTDDQMELF